MSATDNIETGVNSNGQIVTTNEGRVYFSLDGDVYDLEEVTSIIGLQPTETKVKGSRVPETYPAMTTWQVSSEKVISESVDIYEMTASIIRLLEPRKTAILEVINLFKLQPRLQVVLWFSVDEMLSTPILGFDSATLKFLAEVGACIDIDTYKH